MSDGDNGSNVRSLPLDSADVLRHGVEAFREYVRNMQPPKPDPRASERSLFDQIVLLQLSRFGDHVGVSEAIAAALAVVKARRSLDELPYATSALDA